MREAVEALGKVGFLIMYKIVNRNGNMGISMGGVHVSVDWRVADVSIEEATIEFKMLIF